MDRARGPRGQRAVPLPRTEPVTPCVRRGAAARRRCSTRSPRRRRRSSRPSRAARRATQWHVTLAVPRQPRRHRRGRCRARTACRPHRHRCGPVAGRVPERAARRGCCGSASSRAATRGRRARRTVATRLAPLGFEPEARPFHPHLTLGACRRGHRPARRGRRARRAVDTARRGRVAEVVVLRERARGATGAQYVPRRDPSPLRALIAVAAGGAADLVEADDAHDLTDVDDGDRDARARARHAARRVGRRPPARARAGSRTSRSRWLSAAALRGPTGARRSAAARSARRRSR